MRTVYIVRSKDQFLSEKMFKGFVMVDAITEAKKYKTFEEALSKIDAQTIESKSRLYVMPVNLY